MTEGDAEPQSIDLSDVDAAARLWQDGYYDDGQGTAFSMPDVVAVEPAEPRHPTVEGSPDPSPRTTVHLEGGASVDVDERPQEMVLLFRMWGRARREARRVFASPADTRAEPDAAPADARDLGVGVTDGGADGEDAGE